MSLPHQRPLRLGTRGSPLALAQAGRIARQLRERPVTKAERVNQAMRFVSAIHCR